MPRDRSKRASRGDWKRNQDYNHACSCRATRRSSLVTAGGENDILGPWVGEVPHFRSSANEADFVIERLRGKTLSLQEAQKVLEVVVVSQTQLLAGLLWRIRGGKTENADNIE